ncbi:hypothetical protein FPQ18DRAFT_360234 [Pyronema domesticum]|uniref:Cytochrome c oxidase assembly factor 3 n=1 Tax=Pyronema omphalodes (strain CBS 100304) TaxID=1076935 RepID=U4LT58_PYROM|nr:hypothetical protein FPQ18DRAFT_360234 [Pyronema domesticum]CCX34874.1 Similar to Cytochrome oxidase assembly protein 3, mitochondrial; acc. no. Q6CHT7 [Pyronema omphalodes CBS 100304]
MFSTRLLLQRQRPRESQNSYYDADMRQGQSMIRARRPFVVKNALTGLAIAGFTACVYAYTIRAVAQDNFEDVPIPDAPIQRPASAGTIATGPLAK